MPITLKNLNASIPGGFQWTQRETGWNNLKACPSSQWDVRLLARELQKNCRANLNRFPHLPTDYTVLLNMVVAGNALRISKLPNTESYLIRTEDSPPKSGALPTFSQKLRSVVEGVRKLNAGRLMLLEWEDKGYPNVPQEQANARAAVCLECPKNGRGALTNWFTAPAAAMIQRQIERLTEKSLSTPLDDKLGTCQICLCALRVKVHTPMEFIKTYMSPEIRGELSQVRTAHGKPCWVVA